MTGYGDGRHESNGTTVAVEIRSVNSRYLKASVRGLDSAAFESKVESLIRKHIHRGTVNVTVRLTRTASPDDYRINRDVVKALQTQLASLCNGTNFSNIDLGTLIQLPGVVEGPETAAAVNEEDWGCIEPAVMAAIASLEKMRSSEGAAMAKDFTTNLAAIAERVESINARAPEVIKGYQSRITERINGLLEEFDVSITGTDVAREVGMFAERVDISEEIVRLRSHLEQFGTIAGEKESAGRKLEFLIQEIFRETNTIGSKANDSQIAMEVVEIKTHIERMREMVQNVE